MPSVGNYRQGMLVSVPLHLDTLPGKPGGADLHAALAKRYAGSKYVSVMPLENAATKGGKLEPEALNETNKLELYVFASEKHRQAVLVARLDNLGKGASGAAVQNMRLMLGLAETVADARCRGRARWTTATLQFYRGNAEAYAGREITSRQARLTRFWRCCRRAPPSSNSDAAPAATPRKCWRAGSMSRHRWFAGNGSGRVERLGRPVETLLFHELDAVEAYDGVWANACLLHVPRTELADVLALIWRALKPAGCFYRELQDRRRRRARHAQSLLQLSLAGLAARDLRRSAGNWNSLSIETRRGQGL